MGDTWLQTLPTRNSTPPEPTSVPRTLRVLLTNSDIPCLFPSCHPTPTLMTAWSRSCLGPVGVTFLCRSLPYEQWDRRHADPPTVGERPPESRRLVFAPCVRRCPGGLPSPSAPVACAGRLPGTCVTEHAWPPQGAFSSRPVSHPVCRLCPGAPVLVTVDKCLCVCVFVPDPSPMLNLCLLYSCHLPCSSPSAV